MNTIRETEEFNVLNYAYLYNGGGVAIGDINNDQLPDIYFTGNLVASRLYLNQGNLRFVEIADKAGVTAEGLWNTGTVMADVNADGYLDIYVCRSAARIPARRRNLLFINNQDLTFTERAEEYGLDDPSYSTHAAFFDYDCDGDLDAFILNHSLDQYAGFSDQLNDLKKQRGDQYSDKLFRNDGNHYTDISEQAGLINNVVGFGLGLAVVDVNADNFPDLYISNDYNEEDYLYVNQGDGTFRECLREAMGHVSLSSMGNESGDLNNDLRPDIISLDMLPENPYDYKMSIGPEHFDKYNRLLSMGFYFQTLRNMLQLNNGNGTFSEIGQLAGIPATYWSWAPLLADYDNDGWKDLFISNGYGKNYLDMDVIGFVVDEKLMAQRENRQLVSLDLLSKIPDLMSHNYAYKNNGDFTFSNVSDEWGFEGRTLSNGTAYGDLDNDGDLDLVINNIDDFAQIYRNNSESLVSNNFIKVQLKGRNGNTYGIGSKVIVKTQMQSQYQELMPSRGYQSSMNPELLFGLGDHSMVDSLIVIWPDSSVQELVDISANQTLVLLQGEAKKTVIQQQSAIPIFTESPSDLGINFTHHENEFADFRLDKLIPRGLSGKGPGVAKGDINKDGLEDLYLGGGKGQSGELYLQQPDGVFFIKQIKDFEMDSMYEDTDALFFDVDGDGDLDLFVTSGGITYNDKEYLQDRLYINEGQANFRKAEKAMPGMETSNSCVTAADIDGDLDLDLFVGGQIIPGSYPVAPRSYLLRNNGKGKFTDITLEICKNLMNPGMVNDAVFTDINQDAKPDLVLAGEWMEIKVFLNENGFLNENKTNGLENSPGWWNSVTADDFDLDGDIDLVAGNMGLNNSFNASLENPLHLFYGDFDNNGKMDPIMTYSINGIRTLAFSRDELINQVNSFSSKFPDYNSYAVLEERNILTVLNISECDSLTVTNFQSTVFLNDGKGNFINIPLPVQAQFSPVYSIYSTDINGDKYPDMILGGNQSNTRVSTGKFDALYGLVLIGKGDGHFSPMDPVRSGIKVIGDIRAITGLQNRYGQYILFALNNGETILYRKNDNK